MNGLYAIVDPERCADRDPVAVARAILAGGCAKLQLRDKRSSDADMLALARAIGAECRKADVRFVVNDRPHIAVLADADELHLGQDDLALTDARALLSRLGHRAMRIGVSTHDEAQARAAIEGGADLIGFGPVFATTTKENADPVVGVERLREVCRSARKVGVVAIGGIDRARAAEVAKSGARWAAAISAVCGASDPEDAARALHTTLRDAGRKGSRR